MLEELFGHDLQAGFLVILNLILIESLLSIDNAAVLATMVSGLPEDQRKKALKYGILGAYFFRGICLIFATILVQIAWLKALGGLYLIWLAFDFFREHIPGGKILALLVRLFTLIAFTIFDQSHTMMSVFLYEIDLALLVKVILGIYALWTGWKLYQMLAHKPIHDRESHPENHLKKDESNPLEKLIGKFWYTVAMVEIVDLTFSIDNVFAAVAFTDKIGLICLGVFIGILAMRFAAQVFVKLIERFDFLEEIAFIVIGILGGKLLLSYACDAELFFQNYCAFQSTHEFDMIISLLTIGFFALPVLSSIFLHFPRQKNSDA
ncbi:MAG: hypothetical protein SFT81_01100 [Candidatus Caenarcaniphilales bacterium]|nr:hypothetical protein [Candidatus Caenarcaniphilales bacterium]